MQKTNKGLLFSLALTLAYTFSNSFAITHSEPTLLPASHANSKHYHSLWDRIRDGFRLNHFTQHDKVQYYISKYTEHPSYVRLLTKRSEPFLYYITKEAEARELPLELVLLPMIESGFTQNAVSYAGAVGLWQLMPDTATYFGVNPNNEYHSGRYNFQETTQAALSYLSYLNDFFDGNWLLALAAYNSGEGTVQRAVRNNLTNGISTAYWSLKLPRQTSNYIPKLLALAEIIQNPSKYGLELYPIQNKQHLEAIRVPSHYSASQLAHIASMSTKEMKTLNPGYQFWKQNKWGDRIINVPLKKVSKLERAISPIKNEFLYVWEKYKIRPGDNLIKIAKKFHTHVSTIKKLNNLTTHNIRAGKTLTVPVRHKNPMAKRKPITVQIANKTQAFRNKVQMYTVKHGDNLSRIAKKFNLRINDLLTWNNLNRKDLLHINQKLKVKIGKFFIWESKKVS